MEAEERAKEELAVCKEAAEQAEAAFAARLEGHTSTSVRTSPGLLLIHGYFNLQKCLL